MNTKSCSKCCTEYTITEEFFRRVSRSSHRFRSWCRSCEKEYSKEYRKKNKEKVADRIKKWRDENPDRVAKYRREYQQKWVSQNREKQRKYMKEYRRKNKEKIAAQELTYQKRRYAEDPVWRARITISRAIYRGIIRSESIKNSNTWHLLPYTPEELLDHLETQFKTGMTRDNYGSMWHIDHIVPQAHPDMVYGSIDDPKFLKCWALANLQPLFAHENLHKGSLFAGIRHRY